MRRFFDVFNLCSHHSLIIIFKIIIHFVIVIMAIVIMILIIFMVIIMINVRTVKSVLSQLSLSLS